MLPRAETTARVALYLGTVPFAVGTIAIIYYPAGPAAAALTSYSAMILAFIGGLQQAAAVAGGDPRLVLTGVGVALCGWGLVLRGQLRTLGIFEQNLSPGESQQVELLLLAALYGWQAWLEAYAWQGLPSAPLLQSRERLPSMAVAATCLLLAARCSLPNSSPQAASGLLANSQWLDESYAAAAVAATVLALMGAALADAPQRPTD